MARHPPTNKNKHMLEVTHSSLWRERLPLILFGGNNGQPEGCRAMNDALRADIIAWKTAAGWQRAEGREVDALPLVQQCQ